VQTQREGPTGKRKLARPRRRWENNIKKCLLEVELEAWNILILLKRGTGAQFVGMH